MTELFKTVLLLSGFSGSLVLLLLCLKPITAKYLPAQWQFLCWVLVTMLALVPLYKLIPRQAATALPITTTIQPKEPLPDVILEGGRPTLDSTVTAESTIIPLTQKVPLWETLARVWAVGCFVFLLGVLLTYLVFLLKKRKRSVVIVDNGILQEVQNDLKIRRRVRLKSSPSVESPLLIGIVFPVIYLPCRDFSDEQLRMVFLHELTHLKRHDLLFKWIAVFVNTIHWFNPLVYLLTANIGESCEIACDMTVTHNMDEEEQKSYMKTILDLLEKKEEMNV